MSIEAGVLIDKDGMPLRWHLPPDRSSGYIPDDAEFWAYIWENRFYIGAFAHSHPGGGRQGPSFEDLTSFLAIEQALGTLLDWWIITSDSASFFTRKDKQSTVYAETYVKREQEPAWVETVRKLSRYQGE